MKLKIEISICTGLMLNDHSNPYVESTTLLSYNYNTNKTNVAEILSVYYFDMIIYDIMV